MSVELLEIEKRAQDASMLTAFKDINLLSIKSKLNMMLNHIGDDGIFDEYTKHDLSHVENVLRKVDMLIPDDTKGIMTHADWLVIVLSVYFHDLGMFVSKEEFDNRNNDLEYSEFYSGLSTEDFTIKLKELSPDRRERFIYQEYVRKNHGKRIKDWINEVKDNLEPVGFKKAFKDLFIGINKNLRNCLAVICCSHTENVLDENVLIVDKDLGTTSQETANLLYAAILLRTADLLDVTHERTPHVEYQIISPQDEKSQLEWQKQMAVANIRPRVERDSDGNKKQNLPKHAFEVQAHFEDENVFFDFNSYLNYAEAELKKSKKICDESAKKNDIKYYFPWDCIDRSRITTEGFRKEKLSFQIDQNKILNLLIGHTLYNDSSVVLRELVQNGIDACRFMSHSIKEGTNYTPKVSVSWNSQKRELIFSDNGTGMSYEDIYRHLLSVGSSKYQTSKFKTDFPLFHSISRFGIGLLTCFMISDEIDVYTKSKESPSYLLKIRNLHGCYILKENLDISSYVDGNHGSAFVLKVRSDVDMTSIEQHLRKWIILPECSVTLLIDKQQEMSIGYESGNLALQTFYECPRNSLYDYKIENYKEGNISISFLMRKNKWDHTWNFSSLDEFEYGNNPPIGICIEGIKVSSETPGLNDSRFIALVNCCGIRSPKTNVARTNIENCSEKNEMLTVIYKGYMEIVKRQMEDMQKTHNLSWVSKETLYTIGNIYKSQYQAKHELENLSLFEECLMNVECLLLEDCNISQLVSLNSLPEKFYTVESVAYKSAENLVKEIKDCNHTAVGLLNSLVESYFPSDGKILSCFSSHNYLNDLFIQKYEPHSFNIDLNNRRIDIVWGKTNELWYRIRTDYYRKNNGCGDYLYVLKKDNLKDINDLSEDVIISKSGMFILSGNELHNYLLKCLQKNDLDKNVLEEIAAFVRFCCYDERNREEEVIDLEDIFSSEISMSYEKQKEYFIDDLKKIIKNTKFKIFSVERYYRNDFDV